MAPRRMANCSTCRGPCANGLAQCFACYQAGEPLPEPAYTKPTVMLARQIATRHREGWEERRIALHYRVSLQTVEEALSMSARRLWMQAPIVRMK